MSDDGDYEVGYGKPPISGRFKKGRSGTPKGRPKGRKTMNTIIEDAFRMKVTIREGGKPRRLSFVEALVLRVLTDGVKGDGKAADQSIKLLGLMASHKDGNALADDGSIPNEAADLEALQKFLELYDISQDGLNAGGQGDDEAVS